MSEWDPWDRFRAAPRLPPPARGLKIKKAGTTWWGARWIAALERFSGDYASRLGRGKTYARAGRVHDLIVAPGSVTAQVTGSRPRPYVVTIEIETLDAGGWGRVTGAMAARAEFTAELLDGRMPEAIDEAFSAARQHLFPTRQADLETSCSCPDWANPCKHVAATHYVLGEAFDRDPFLLFELRGSPRAEVLEALRRSRRDPRPRPARPQALPAAGVKLGRIRAAEYDGWRAEVPRLGISLEPSRTPGALLRSLGAPASWTRAEAPADLLAPTVAAIAARTREAALAEPAPPTGPSGRAPRPGRAGGTRRGAAARRRGRRRGRAATTTAGSRGCRGTRRAARRRSRRWCRRRRRG